MFEHGVVVGKFSPLHKGHELLINAALAQCHKVTVISYSKPELPGCEAARRRCWLQALFPGVNALVFDEAEVQGWRQQGWKLPLPDNGAADIRQREFVAELLWQRQWRDVDVVFSSETYGEGFAAYLQQYFTRTRRSHHKVVHVCVDPTRTRVPISASQIRANIHAQRQYLSPAVYADFVKRICFIGGESSGKSTLARALATRYATEWVPEFGRYWWQLKNGELEAEDYLHIAREQQRLETVAAQRADEFVFCDTNAIVTLCYYEDQFHHPHPQLLQAALRHYDGVFLCENDFEFVQDGSRRDACFSARQQHWMVDFLERNKLSYVAINGSLEARIEQVSRLLSDI